MGKSCSIDNLKKAKKRNVGRIKNGSMELLDLSVAKVSTQFDIKPTLETKSGSFFKEWGPCPYDILLLEIKRVVDFHVLLCELEKHAYARIGDAEVKNKKLEGKLIGFRFTMEDQKVVVVEAEDSIIITKTRVEGDFATKTQT